MRAALGLCFVSLAGALATPMSAQSDRDRTQKPPAAPIAESRSENITLHNPYTSGSISTELVFPPRPRPLAAVALLTGSSPRERQAAESLALALARRGFAVMTMPPPAPSGATEDDNLNTVAALHYLQTRQDLRGAPVGLIGYGDGVRLAAVTATEGNPAAFLVLLGGAVVPDRLNSVPDSLSRSSLPKIEAVRSLQRLRSPILIVIGEYDRQGTHRSAAENSDVLRGILDARRHDNYTIKVLGDTDYLLADAGAGGGKMSASAVPAPSVWALAADWMAKQAKAVDRTDISDDAETTQAKPTRIYPKSVYGPFAFRPWYVWQPAIGDQPRPYGYWYW